jgi:hypothetical protein
MLDVNGDGAVGILLSNGDTTEFRSNPRQCHEVAKAAIDGDPNLFARIAQLPDIQRDYEKDARTCARLRCRGQACPDGPPQRGLF